MSGVKDISAIGISDYDAIARFCVSQKEDGRSVDYWVKRFSHWWEGNPAMEVSFPRGVKLVDGDRLVGVCCCIPVRIQFEGEPVLAAIRSTWIVDQGYRHRSLQLFTMLDEMLSNLLNINCTPVDEVIPILKAFQWESLREQVSTSFRVASMKGTVRKLFSRSPVITDLPKFLTHPAFGLDMPKVALLADQVWNRRAEKFNSGPVRDAAYFQWYSVDNPTSPFSWFVSTGEDSIPIFALGTHFGDGAYRLMDVWPMSSRVSDYGRLLRWVGKVAAENGFHSLRVPHFFPELALACSEQSLFFKRTEPQRFFVKYPEEMPRPNGVGHWPLNSGDIGI